MTINEYALIVGRNIKNEMENDQRRDRVNLLITIAKGQIREWGWSPNEIREFWRLVTQALELLPIDDIARSQSSGALTDMIQSTAELLARLQSLAE